MDVDLYGLITDNGTIRGYTDKSRQAAVGRESSRNGEQMTKRGIFREELCSDIRGGAPAVRE